MARNYEGQWSPEFEADRAEEERWPRRPASFRPYGQRPQTYGQRPDEWHGGVREDERGHWGLRHEPDLYPTFQDAPGGPWDRPHERRGPYAGRGPRNYTRSNERIREEVSDRLADHAWVDASDIEVQADDGVVTLAGSVEDRTQKRIAEDVADSVSGVRDVNNQLRIDPSLHMDRGARHSETVLTP